MFEALYGGAEPPPHTGRPSRSSGTFWLCTKRTGFASVRPLSSAFLGVNPRLNSPSEESFPRLRERSHPSLVSAA